MDKKGKEQDSKYSYKPKEIITLILPPSGKKIPVFLLLIFGLLSASLWYAGSLYYSNLKNNIKEEIKSEIKSLSVLKSFQISTWVNERLNDAEFISGNPLQNNEINDFVNGKSVKNDDLKFWLKSMVNHYDYQSAILVDKNEKNKIIISNVNDTAIGKFDEDFIKKNINKKKPVISDIITGDSVNNNNRIDIFIPFFNIKNNDTVFISALVLVIDPNKYLYPLLTYKPEQFSTSEIILFKKEKNNILILNELTQKKFEGLNIRMPLTSELIPAVQLKKDPKEVFEGLDYRNKEVLSAYTPVEGTEWFLLVKIDKGEIYSSITEESKLITVLVISLIIISGVLLIFFWRHQKTKFYRQQLESRMEIDAITKHYNFMIKYANDAIILTDSDWKIIEFNKKVLSMYGYDSEELKNMNLTDLRTDIAKNYYNEHLDEIEKTGGRLFETTHITKDRKIIPIENSFRVLNIEGKKYYQSIIRDITERIESERKLKESEAELRALFASMHDVIIVLDKDGRYIKIAPTNPDLLYKQPEELLGKTIHEVLPQKSADLFQSYIDIVLKNKKSIDVEYDLNIGDKIVWFEATISILQEDKVLFIARDASERINKENQIKQLTRIYKVLSNVNQAIVRFRNLNDLYDEVCKIIVDDGNFKMAWIGIIDENSGELNITSKYGDKTNYLERLNIILQSDEIKNSPVSKSLLNGEYSICNDVENEYINESPNWTKNVLDAGFRSIASFPILSFGKPLGIIGIYSSETEFFKETEIELFRELSYDVSFAMEFFEKEELIRKLSSGIEHSFASISVTDLDGVIEFVNPKFYESTGYTLEDLVGKNVKMLRPPLLWKEEEENLWKVLREKGEWKGELPIQNKNGDIFWEYAVISPIKNDKGEITHLLSVKEDITKRKQAEIELKNAKEKAEEANRLKTNFLANMSHELRTPMTGIIGFAEMLFTELDEPELKEMAELILKGSKRLTDTLNSILDLSSIESDKIEVNLIKTDIVSLTKDATRIFEVNIKNKGLFLGFKSVKDEISCELDERLYTQIINNILNNAIKFTEKGGIDVEISLMERNGFENVVVSFKDSGIGIPKKDLDKIFEPFRQVSEGLNRKFEGTGLGLTLAKNFIDMMNGKIEVESKPGSGSIFRIILPVNVQEKVSLRKKRAISDNPIEIKNKLKILHVEDDFLGRKVVKVLLKNYYDISDVVSGEEALKEIAKNKYELILMDINLKGMSGLETVKEIRKIKDYKETPIIAVTAFAMVGDKEKFLKNGCSDYISKPFTKEELINIIEKIRDRDIY